MIEGKVSDWGTKKSTRGGGALYSTSLAPEESVALEVSGSRWNRRCAGTLKRRILSSASVPPPCPIQSKERGPATPATEPGVQIGPHLNAYTHSGPRTCG